MLWQAKQTHMGPLPPLPKPAKMSQVFLILHQSAPASVITSVSLTLVSPSTFKELCDYFGPRQIISILRSADKQP